MTATNPRTAPLASVIDPFALSARLRELGCAVAIFVPEELGQIADTREIEDAMVEAGNRAIETMNEGLDDLSPAERHEASGHDGPCADLAPDASGDNRSVCTTCLHHAVDHPTGTGVLSPAVTAEAHSDDWRVEVSFDATAWFATASDDELAALVGIGYGGDYAADAVADYYRHATTKGLFDYLDAAGTGFECRVDSAQAEAWLAAHRPSVLTRD